MRCHLKALVIQYFNVGYVFLTVYAFKAFLSTLVIMNSIGINSCGMLYSCTPIVIGNMRILQNPSELSIILKVCSPIFVCIMQGEGAGGVCLCHPIVTLLCDRSLPIVFHQRSFTYKQLFAASILYQLSTISAIFSSCNFVNICMIQYKFVPEYICKKGICRMRGSYSMHLSLHKKLMFFGSFYRCCG